MQRQTDVPEHQTHALGELPRSRFSAEIAPGAESPLYIEHRPAELGFHTLRHDVLTESEPESIQIPRIDEPFRLELACASRRLRL